jgi:hypothetical protein
MNQSSNDHYRIPQSIPEVHQLFSGYLRENHPKAFIWGINTSIDVSGQFVYKVELSDPNTLFHLMFSLDGNLISKTEETLLPA